MDVRNLLIPVLAVLACLGIAILVVSLLRGPVNSMEIPLPEETPPLAEANSGQLILDEVVKLPAHKEDGSLAIEAALAERRSIRAYLEEPLHLGEISQLLWSAGGITCTERGYRTAPSAGATFPLELYLVVGEVTGLSEGLYRYEADRHQLRKESSEDLRQDLYRAALQQIPVRDAAVLLVFTAVYERTTRRYGERGIRYVHMEAGHAAQNAYLQAVSLELGTVVIGAFDDDEVTKIMQLPPDESPLYIMPFGRR